MTADRALAAQTMSLEALASLTREAERIRVERDATIRKAQRAGCSLRAIAAATGLNHETVRTIAREGRA